MEYSYLNETLMILAAAVAMVVLFLRIGLPPILGYLAVGLLIGPYGLAFVSNVEHIKFLAEFGVVFLLFTVGLEFSVSQLMHMRSTVLGLGAGQVFVTAAVVAVVASYLGLSLEISVLLGGVIAMSSTALVTKQLSDQVELHTRHGRNSVSILLFQDLMVVPLLILVAMIGGTANELTTISLLIALAEGALALLLIFAIGRWVLKPLFREVARFRSEELFTVTVLLVVLLSSWVTYQIGLTFALGAFLAGVMLSETEFRHQVESEIRPFRDVLLGLFFITVGMMLNMTMLPDIWGSVVILLIFLVLFKMFLIQLLCRLSGWNSAVSMRTGLIMAHGGEFGFAILMLAMDSSILGQETGQIVLAAMLCSMAFAPIVIRYNGLIARFLMPKAIAESRKQIKDQVRGVSRELDQHVIICGFGRVGRYTATQFGELGIPYMAVDLDQNQVQQGKASSQYVSYGDAASLQLLRACGLSRAAAVVITMIDFKTTIRIISRIRDVDSEIPVVVRARKEEHLYHFYQAGASEVVADIYGKDQMVSESLLDRLNLLKNSKVL